MHLSARRSVIIGLLITQICTIALLALISDRSGRTAESEHTVALLNTATAESADRVRSHIAPAESLVSLVSSLPIDGASSPDDLVPAFRTALVRNPQLAAVFVGTARGGFTFLARQPDGYRLKSISVDGGQRRVVLTEMDADGRALSSREDPTDTFTPTSRPWYTAAMGAPDTPVWTDPYVFFTSGALGVTAAQAIPGEDGSAGVVGADIELGSLSDFLGTLRVGDDGSTVIVDDSGTVIAHPDRDLTHNTSNGVAETITIAELDDGDARAAVSSVRLAGSASTPDGVDSATEFRSASGGTARVAHRVVPVGDGQWTIAVFGTQEGFLGGIATARARERILIIAAGAVAALLMLLAALPAARRLGRLESEARTDELTGMPNRRSILRRSEKLLRSSTGGAAAILDLDHFKKINDTHGHQVGDEVLRVVSRRIQSTLRQNASVGRIGGEEFLILLPEMGSMEAATTCERIRRAICVDAIATSVGDLTVTASIGVAESHVGEGKLIARADAALRAAKRAGRNRVERNGAKTAVPARL